MSSDSVESLEFRDGVTNSNKRRSKEDIDEITFLDLEESDEEYGDLEVENSVRISTARAIPFRSEQNYDSAETAPGNPVLQPNSVSELVEGVMRESLSDFKDEHSVEVLKSSDSEEHLMNATEESQSSSLSAERHKNILPNLESTGGDTAVGMQVSNLPEGAIPAVLHDISRESSSGDEGGKKQDSSSVSSAACASAEDKRTGSSGVNERMYSHSSFCKSAAEFIHKTVDENGDTKALDKDAENIRLTKREVCTRERKRSSYGRYAREAPSDKRTASVPRTKNSGDTDFIAKNINMVSSTPLRSDEPKRRKRPLASRDNRPKGAGTTRSRSRSEGGRTTKTAQTEKRVSSEWSILDDSQLISFRKLFSRFDQTKSGGISDKELFYAIQDLLPDEKIPFKDVQKIHAEFDLKQTGEIEFDEFLFAMTNPRNYLKLIDDDDRKQLTKEIKLWEEFQNGNYKAKLEQDAIQPKEVHVQNAAPDQNKDDSNIFFTMLRTAARKESMKEIRRFYVNKIKKRNDHVIHDWSEGQRCIGLSDQDVLRRYNHIMKELKDKQSSSAKGKLYRESPYAKPLYWGLAELKDNLAAGERKKSGQPVVDRKHPKPPKSPLRRSRSEQEESTKLTEASKDVAKEQARKEKATRLPKSVDQGKLVSQIAYKHAYRAYSTPPSDIKSLTGVKKADGKRRVTGVRSAPPRRVKISEFVVTPKVVPLPTYPIRDSSRYFDYDDLEEIRKQAATILQKYYDKLKKVSATNSKVYYKKLQVDQIRPLLRSRFKQSYLAYAGEFEPFVVSPWIPYPVPTPWIPYRPLGISCRARSA